MKYIRAILFSLVGVALSMVVFFVMLIYFRAIYGLVVSLMGTLAGLHAALGYIGRKKVVEKDIERVRIVSVISALIASLLPYLLLVGLTDVADAIFIVIGAYGGFMGANFILAQKFRAQNPTEDRSEGKHRSIDTSFSQRLTIILHKMTPVIIRNVIWLIPLLLLTLVVKEIGVAWFVVIGFFIYDLFRYQVFTITDEDMENLTNSDDPDSNSHRK